MSTASTKSSRKKQAKQSGNVRSDTEAAKTIPASQTSIPERTWLIAAIVIMAVAAVLRLYDLKLVPLHHDEGVNGNFLVHLVRDGVYRYDPQNYHGPTLYYFSAIIPWTIRFLFGTTAQNAYGLTTFDIRLVTALFGLGTIWLVLLLRRRLGAIASLAAAAMIAVSPGAVYLSRYFIHESLFVFFTLGIVVALVKYYDEAHPVYLILASASAALLFATKETWIITVPVLLIALLSTHLYRWWWRAMGLEGRQRGMKPASLSEWFKSNLDRFGGPSNLAIWAALAIVVCVTVGVLFYSSFMTNWKGVVDSLETFKVWTKTSKEAHAKDWWVYLLWLKEEESTLLLLGAIGAIAAFLKPKNSMALFCGLWAFGILAAYSLVPYKTPWLALNFIVPLALIGGYAFEAFYELVGRELSRPIILGAAVVLSVSCYQMIILNFFKYDDDGYIYVYAHTRRETLDMLDQIEKVAKRSGTGFETGITIVSPEYWPLPWYFRDYKRVGYYGRVAMSNEPILIASESQRAEVQATYGDRYRQINSKYPLRPGVDLLLFVRNDVAGP